MNPKRMRVLLIALAVLGSVRFLLIPWLDYQAESIERLSVLTKRLDRASALIQNREQIAASLVRAERETLAVRGRFPQAVDLQTFRLSAQERVTEAVARRGFGIKLFEWAADGELKQAGLRYSRARVQLEGGFRDLATLQADLEASFPNMLVKELTVASPASIRAPDDVVVSMNLVVDFYFRPASAS